MGWISWLCPGVNIKRWLLLAAFGILLCAVGLAMLFNFQFIGRLEEMLFQFTYYVTGRYSNGIIMSCGALIFVLGIGCVARGTRKVVRSVVASLIPDASGKLMEKIFVQRKLTRGPAITVVGGGTGLSTMLRGMKYITNNVTAVVAMGDDGGSSGRLRKELGIVPPGDLRNCMTALADQEPEMERLLKYRFKGDSPLAGHCFGNLLIAAMAEAEGGMEQGLKTASQILKVRGHVVPSTLEDIQLQAEMTDGTVVTGESHISEAGKHIKTLKMIPEDAPAAKDAVEAILKSDVLIFGPGSLYTSVIPNLLVDGVRKAILESKAIKIYICNVMTQPGETDGYGAYEHVRALIDHAGAQFLDYVIVNDEKIPAAQLAPYREQGAKPVRADMKKLTNLGINVVPARLISKEDLVRHDPVKLSKVLINLIYRLRLFGKGVQFFDYFFVRLGLSRMQLKK